MIAGNSLRLLSISNGEGSYVHLGRESRYRGLEPDRTLPEGDAITITAARTAAGGRRVDVLVIDANELPSKGGGQRFARRPFAMVTDALQAILADRELMDMIPSGFAIRVAAIEDPTTRLTLCIHRSGLGTELESKKTDSEWVRQYQPCGLRELLPRVWVGKLDPIRIQSFREEILSDNVIRREGHSIVSARAIARFNERTVILIPWPVEVSAELPSVAQRNSRGSIFDTIRGWVGF